MKRQFIAASILLATVASAAAQEGAPDGQPHSWEIGLQRAFSPVAEQMHWFNSYILFFIIPVVVLVGALLAWVVFRFGASRNATPSQTSHNTVIEVVWTVAPVIVLILIAIPSFQLLTLQYNPPSDPEMTVKVTGYQWYWNYEYQPESGDGAEPAEAVAFDSYLLQDGDRAGAGKEDMAAYPRLLAVDNELVVPVNTVVRVLATAGDVIHSFAVPSFGIKVDAVPGRMNEYWFSAEKEGMFYGQCSELCGKDHAFMPIAVRVVSKDQFDTWLSAAGTSVEDANKQLMAEIQAADAVEVAGR
ncbi:cytochrome c oxidase subunit II [Consotaella aegiceratis]|uniref:cytochrome c oxidase subunit II n=1 Tax=Consotaella aegiceratis TaxID=3097961 RepID=UPI002F422F61